MFDWYHIVPLQFLKSLKLVIASGNYGRVEVFGQNYFNCMHSTALFKSSRSFFSICSEVPFTWESEPHDSWNVLLRIKKGWDLDSVNNRYHEKITHSTSSCLSLCLLTMPSMKNGTSLEILRYLGLWWQVAKVTICYFTEKLSPQSMAVSYQYLYACYDDFLQISG